jgi:hypothetical protein
VVNTVSKLSALEQYFNTGDGARPKSDWLKELKALTTEERTELARGVADVTGWNVTGL